MRRLALILTTTLAPIPALAHPGAHADAAHGMAHFLTDPFHVLLVVGALTGARLAAMVVRRARAPQRHHARSGRGA